MGSTVALIGAGFMGEAVIAGLDRARKDPAGSAIEIDRILVGERRVERAEELLGRYDIEVTSNAAAAAAADLLLIVVKPGDVVGVLAEVGSVLKPSVVVVSLAAGVTLATLTAALPDGVASIRVMPNTPALVGKGVLAMSPSAACPADKADLTEEILATLGLAVRVPEYLQDAVTGLSGSGPAYVFAFIEALIDGGVLLGLPRATSRELAIETVLGAATMLKQTGEHPAILRENVTSPGGATAAALRALDDGGLPAAVVNAMVAARDRSKSLG